MFSSDDELLVTLPLLLLACPLFESGKNKESNILDSNFCRVEYTPSFRKIETKHNTFEA
jgi:hypothetical protein